MPGVILRAFLVTTKICIGMPGALLTRSTVAECLHELIDLLVEELFLSLDLWKSRRAGYAACPSWTDQRTTTGPYGVEVGPQVKDKLLLN